jgi:hypothetical protein
VLTFALLDRRQMLLADLPAYVDRIEIYQDFNARFFQLPPTALAQMLFESLEKAGAVRRDGDLVIPA